MYPAVHMKHTLRLFCSTTPPISWVLKLKSQKEINVLGPSMQEMGPKGEPGKTLRVNHTGRGGILSLHRR